MTTDFEKINVEIDVDGSHSLLIIHIRKCLRVIRRLGYDFDDDDYITVSSRQISSIAQDISLIRRVQTIIISKIRILMR